MQQKIIYANFTRYYRAAETKDFVFFVNYQDSEDCIMYRHNGELVSNNYFASVGLADAILADEITWCTRRMKSAIKYVKAEHAEEANAN